MMGRQRLGHGDLRERRASQPVFLHNSLGGTVHGAKEKASSLRALGQEMEDILVWD